MQGLRGEREARRILTQEYGFGLDEHLRAHRHRLVGILNGLDLGEGPLFLASRADVGDALYARAMIRSGK